MGGRLMRSGPRPIKASPRTGKTTEARFVHARMIVHADVTFGQAMGDGGIVRKCEGSGWREDAGRVQRGKHDGRFDAKSPGPDRQHWLSSVTHQEIRCFEDRASPAVFVPLR